MYNSTRASQHTLTPLTSTILYWTRGRAELRDGAGVVPIAYSHSIGVGSPVARLGADGRRRTGSAVRIRRSRCRAGNPGTRRQGRRRRNRRPRPYEGIPIMQSLVQIAIGQRPARAGRSPRSRSRRCSLRTRRRAAVVAEGVGGVETRPLARPPEGNAKEVTRRRRRVTTAALRDDSVVAHGSLPAAWSD